MTGSIVGSSAVGPDVASSSGTSEESWLGGKAGREVSGRVGAQVRPDPTDLVGVERSCRTSGLVGTLPSSSNIVVSVASRDRGSARMCREHVGEGARAV